MRFAELDAVTLDAFGTIVDLADPVPELQRALRERGIECGAAEVRQAFHAEGAYYRRHSFEGHDDTSLVELRTRCAGIFLEALGCDLDPAGFAVPFVGALRFEAIAGVPECIAELRRRGLALAVVSNWDIALAEHLAGAGLGGMPVVTSASVGVAKPDPRPFAVAIEKLGVRPERTLHVGDSDADRDGAAAGGLHFAPAPLTSVLEAAAA
jgi:putative hydrolase of the HAD superfamily